MVGFKCYWRMMISWIVVEVDVLYVIDECGD